MNVINKFAIIGESEKGTLNVLRLMSKVQNFSYQKLSLKSIQSDKYADFTNYLHLKKGLLSP